MPVKGDYSDRLLGEPLPAVCATRECSAHPETAEGWYVWSFATLDYREALERVTKATQLDPTSTHAWLRRLYLHLVSRDEQALECADRLIALEPRSGNYKELKGHVLNVLGRFDEAAQQFNSLIDLDSSKDTLANSTLYCGHAHRGARQHRAAEEDYLQSWNAWESLRQGGTPWRLTHYATVLWINGKYTEALAALLRMHDASGRVTYSDVRRFLVLWEKGEVPLAKEVLRRTKEETYKNDTDQDKWLRAILECLGRAVASETDFSPELLVAEAGNDVERRCEAYYYAGEACLLQKRKAEACKWFQQCKDTNMWFDPNTWPPQFMNEYDLVLRHA